MTDFQKISDLVAWLNQRTIEYNNNCPTVTDKEWDEKYFELKKLEQETGMIFPDSPTQNIQPTITTAVSQYVVLDKLKKVEHNHLMLSLDKTKSLFEVLRFLQEYDYVAMAKMDGLTCSVRYVNGFLVSAETRGDGIVGEDITHNAKILCNLPQHIDYKDELIVDGEIISTYDNFENFEGWFKNPRNFAAGSIRLLDSKECARRNLRFIAWDVIKGLDNISTISERLKTLLRQCNRI